MKGMKVIQASKDPWDNLLTYEIENLNVIWNYQCMKGMTVIQASKDPLDICWPMK